MKQIKIEVKGIVQGVGFRPFVYRLAKSLGIKGYISNQKSGVVIVSLALEEKLNSFLGRIQQEAPLHSRIESIVVTEQALDHFSDFCILQKEDPQNKTITIPPDLSLCEDCKKELFDSNNRRYLYSFITCTQCGPRFSILKDIPFERENTSMVSFPLCEDCKKEFLDPLDRRYHAITLSCKNCGPKLQLLNQKGEVENPNFSQEDIIQRAVELLKQGFILAIKSIGGYHIACNAFNEDSIRILRNRKKRRKKPFAIMFPNLTELSKYVYTSSVELEELSSAAAPIVLLSKKKSILPELISFNNPKIGAMLPFTPLHELLLHATGLPLIMTSGNLSGERIAYKEEEAILGLSNIVDFFLIHNREITNPLDDSVIQFINQQKYFIRKSRGYTPNSFPISSPKPILCVGGELKNTFSIVKENKIVLSQYNGDLSSPSNFDFFCHSVESYRTFYDLKLEVAVVDLHPNYHSTLWAKEKFYPVLEIQHHHAHIASCLGDNNYYEDVIGIAMDGTGYGTDGNLWGGEFFIANRNSFTRKYHLSYIPLIGGERAIVEPWRIAIACLLESGINLEKIKSLPFINNIEKVKLDFIIDLYYKKTQIIYSSGLGRLFDAVSSLLNLCLNSDYEGHTAVELENLFYSKTKEIQCDDEYHLDWKENEMEISWSNLILSIVKDIEQKISLSSISYKFHNAVVGCIIDLCSILRERNAINTVALSGGCFFNNYLLSQTIQKLNQLDFTVLTHKNIPTNDSGISYGQAVIAAEKLNGTSKKLYF